MGVLDGSPQWVSTLQAQAPEFRDASTLTPEEEKTLLDTPVLIIIQDRAHSRLLDDVQARLPRTGPLAALASELANPANGDLTFSFALPSPMRCSAVTLLSPGQTDPMLFSHRWASLQVFKGTRGVSWARWTEDWSLRSQAPDFAQIREETSRSHEGASDAPLRFRDSPALKNLDSPQVNPWLAAIDHFARELWTRSYNPFTRHTSQEILEALERLRTSPNTTREETIAGMMRIVALTSDEHAGVFIESELPWKALSTLRTREGLLIWRAAKPYEHLLGTLVTDVGGTPISQLLSRMHEFMPVRNETQRLWSLEKLLARGQALHALGLIPDARAVPLAVRRPDGARIETTLPYGPIDAPLVTLFPSPEAEPPWFRKASQAYAAELLEREKLLVVSWNACREDSGYPFEKFTDDILSHLASGKVEKVFVDMRVNTGGRSGLLWKIENALAEAPALAGKIFVGIGYRTFSSAILDALSFRKRTGAILIGEPTPGSPNHLGELESFPVPELGLTVNYSTKHFIRAADGVETVLPDVALGQTAADFRAGHDALLEYVRSRN